MSGISNTIKKTFFIGSQILVLNLSSSSDDVVVEAYLFVLSFLKKEQSLPHFQF